MSISQKNKKITTDSQIKHANRIRAARGLPLVISKRKITLQEVRAIEPLDLKELLKTGTVEIDHFVKHILPSLENENQEPQLATAHADDASETEKMYLVELLGDDIPKKLRDAVKSRILNEVIPREDKYYLEEMWQKDIPSDIQQAIEKEVVKRFKQKQLTPDRFNVIRSILVTGKPTSFEQAVMLSQFVKQNTNQRTLNNFNKLSISKELFDTWSDVENHIQKNVTLKELLDKNIEFNDGLKGLPPLKIDLYLAINHIAAKEERWSSS